MPAPRPEFQHHSMDGAPNWGVAILERVNHLVEAKQEMAEDLDRVEDKANINTTDIAILKSVHERCPVAKGSGSSGHGKKSSPVATRRDTWKMAGAMLVVGAVIGATLGLDQLIRLIQAIRGTG